MDENKQGKMRINKGKKEMQQKTEKRRSTIIKTHAD